MKTKMIISLMFGCLMFSGNSFAESELNKIIENKEQNQSTKKKSRRKKVQMCHECGKPEPECECEGEGHGVKDDHDKHKKHSEKKKK